MPGSCHGPNSSNLEGFSMVIQDEKHREIGASSSLNFESQAIFEVKSQPAKQNGKKDHPVCTHCGLIGHTMDKCYKIHQGSQNRNEPVDRAGPTGNRTPSQSV